MTWKNKKLPKPIEGEEILCEDEDGDKFVAKGKKTNNGFATKVEWTNGYVGDVAKVTKRWKTTK